VRVLLLHGMGRTPLSMWRLGRFLSRHGHQVELAGYSATFERFARITTRVRARLLRLSEHGEPYAVVGHSLGGLIARAALADVPTPPARLVLLGTPGQPPRLAMRLVRRWPYRLLNGECGQLLAREEFFTTLPLPPVPITSIAGTAGPRGRWSPFGEELNDWVVAVGEAPQGPGDAPVHVEATHTFLMNHRAVRELILQALDA
jgi:pimeloyl-ACP methyl ester carboxylesterase